MEYLKCNPYAHEYRKCMNCTSRECESIDLEKKNAAYKKAHPEKSWERCAHCGHSCGLRMMDEAQMHPGMKCFCDFWQKYLKDENGLCQFYCN